MKFKAIPTKIVDYLLQHGRMSGRDITDDLGCRPWDVLLAAHEGCVERCAPEPGGVEPWYRVRKAGR